MANEKPGAPKGHPKFGGRVAGTKNVATRLREQATVQALLAEQLTPEQQAELTPLAVMLRVMRARTVAGDHDGALAAAALAAPYVHARLSSSDVHVHNELAKVPTEELDAQAEAMLAELAAKRAAARVVN